MPEQKRRIALTIYLTEDEYAALVVFVSRISGETTLSGAGRYLIVDYLASELGFDLLPVMEL